MPARIPLANGGQVPLHFTGDYTAITPRLSAGDTGLGDALKAVGQLAGTVGKDLLKRQQQENASVKTPADEVSDVLETDNELQNSQQRQQKFEQENEDVEAQKANLETEKKTFFGWLSSKFKGNERAMNGVTPAVEAHYGKEAQRIEQQGIQRKNQKTLDMLLGSLRKAGETGSEVDVATTQRLIAHSGLGTPEFWQPHLDAARGQIHARGVAQVDEALSMPDKERDQEGSILLLQQQQQAGVLTDTEYADRVRSVNYRANRYRLEDLAMADPLSLVKGRGEPDSGIHLLSPQDQQAVMEKAWQQWGKLGVQEIDETRKAVDDLDLEGIRRMKGVEKLRYSDLDLPPLKYAHPVMRDAVDHYMAVKQQKGTLNRPGLYQWARTQVQGYDAYNDPDGTNRQFLKQWINLSFGEKEAAQLQATLDQSVEKPNPFLAMVFRQVDAAIFGERGRQMEFFKQVENQETPGVGKPRLSLGFTQQMPGSMLARAAEAERIKNTLAQALEDGSVTQFGGLQPMADRLLSEKKNDDPTLAYQKAYQQVNGKTEERVAPPGTLFHPSTGQLVSKYSFLHHEAWDTGARHLYGSAYTPVEQGGIGDYTLAQIVGVAHAQGFTHEKTAALLHQWRQQVQASGVKAAGSGEQAVEDYMLGTRRLNELTATTLQELRKDAVQDWALRTFGHGSLDYEDFFAAYEANDGNPAAMGGFRQQAEELNQIQNNPVWKVAQQPMNWLDLADKNGTEVARFRWMPRGGELDVQVNYGDEQEETRRVLLTVPIVTPENLEEMAQAAEAEKVSLQEKINALSAPGRRAERGDPSTRRELERQQNVQTARAQLLRSAYGAEVVMKERVMEALKASPAGEHLGHSDLGEDFLRGWSGFYVGMRVGWNDLTGDEAERDIWRENLQNLRELLPGSTGAQAGFLADVSEAAGGMAPQLIASAATGGASFLSNAARTALMNGGGTITATTLSGIGFGSYGSRVADALARADALEKEGRIEEAEAIRAHYRRNAAVGAVGDMAVEMILPEELALLGKGKGGFLRNLGNNAGKSYLEGFLGSVEGQFVDNYFYGDEFSLSEAAYSGLVEMTATGPITVPGAIPRRQSEDSAVGQGIEHDFSGEDMGSVDADGQTDDSRFAPPTDNPTDTPSITDAQREAQERANQEWESNPEGLVDDYLESNGVFVSGDEAKELFTPYKENPQDNSAAVHGAAMKVADAAWDRLIDQPPKTGLVVLAGGGPGVGKSTVLGGKEAWQGEADAVWDGTLAWYPSTKAMVQKALDSGRRVLVDFVHRPFDQAWEGIMDRAVKTGRTLPLQVAAEKHAQALDAIRQLQEDFGDKITIQVFRNAKGVGEHERITLEELYEETYNQLNETETFGSADGTTRQGHSDHDVGGTGHVGGRAGQSQLPEGQGSPGTWRDLAARWNDSGLHRAEAAARAGRISPALYRALTGRELAPASAASYQGGSPAIDAPATNPYRNADGTLKVPERASSRSDPALAPYEEKLKKIMDDEAQADRLYNALPDAKGGKVIGTDIARELLPEFAKGREGKIRYTNATGRVAQAYAKDRLWREINNPNGRNLLMFTAGGVAAGKSTAVTDEQVAAKDLVFDGTLRESDWAIQTIERALEKGWRVEINYVQRPLDLVIPGAIKRANDGGRWGALADLPAIHQAAQQSVVKIAKHFASDPNVDVYFWLNDGKTIAEKPRLLALEQIDVGGEYSYDENHERATTDRGREEEESRALSESLRSRRAEEVRRLFTEAIRSGNYEPRVLGLLAEGDAELGQILRRQLGGNAQRASPESWATSQEPSADNGFIGTASDPRIQWKPNPGGIVRTLEQAITIAREHGVTIPKYIKFKVMKPGFYGDNVWAKYGHFQGKFNEPIFWRRFFQADGFIHVGIDERILNSDEGIVGIFAHEMHELNGLAARFQLSESMPFHILESLIGRSGRLHTEAWDISDALILEMRRKKYYENIRQF